MMFGDSLLLSSFRSSSFVPCVPCVPSLVVSFCPSVKFVISVVSSFILFVRPSLASLFCHLRNAAVAPDFTPPSTATHSAKPAAGTARAGVLAHSDGGAGS